METVAGAPFRDGPSAWPDRWLFRAVLFCTPNTDSHEADAMRKLTFAMNLSLDGYIAAPGDDLGWSDRATSCSSGGPTGSGRPAWRCTGGNCGKR